MPLTKEEKAVLEAEIVKEAKICWGRLKDFCGRQNWEFDTQIMNGITTKLKNA